MATSETDAHVQTPEDAHKEMAELRAQLKAEKAKVKALEAENDALQKKTDKVSTMDALNKDHARRRFQMAILKVQARLKDSKIDVLSQDAQVVYDAAKVQRKGLEEKLAQEIAACKKLEEWKNSARKAQKERERAALSRINPEYLELAKMANKK